MSDRETRNARLQVGAFVAASLAVFVFLVFKLGSVSLRPRIHGQSVVADVTGLVEGARVTVAGVPVGRVTGLSVEKGQARVALVLYEGHGLTEGASVEVRSRSLLGEKFVAALPAPSPGPPLADGFTLPARPAAPSPDELMARLAGVLDRFPLEELAENLQRIDGFLDRLLPQLDEALDGASLSEIGAAARAVREAVEAERPALHRTVAALGDAAEAWGPVARGPELRDAVAGVARAAEQLAKVDGEVLGEDARLLADALRRLPGTLDRVDRTLDTLARLDPILVRLEKLDEAGIREVLQEEGVRIRFSSPRPGEP